jgi:hypothetical protein
MNVALVKRYRHPVSSQRQRHQRARIAAIPTCVVSGSGRFPNVDVHMGHANVHTVGCVQLGRPAAVVVAREQLVALESAAALVSLPSHAAILGMWGYTRYSPHWLVTLSLTRCVLLTTGVQKLVGVDCGAACGVHGGG